MSLTDIAREDGPYPDPAHEPSTTDRPAILMIPRPALCVSLIKQDVGGGSDIARVFDFRGHTPCRLCTYCTAREVSPGSGFFHCLLFSPTTLDGSSALGFGIRS